MKTDIKSEIKEYLDAFTVDFPSEEEIDFAIQDLHKYVPIPTQNGDSRISSLKRLLVSTGKEAATFSLSFWLLSGLFLVFGIIGTKSLGTNPYLTIFIVSPLPFLIGLVEVFKSRDAGLLEIENSCRYTGQQLILSKILVVALFNLFINSFLVIWFYSNMNLSITLANLLVFWLLPFVGVSTLGLVITTYFKGTLIAPIMTAIWLAFSLYLSKFLIERVWVNRLTLCVSLVVIGFSIALFIIMLSKLKRGNLLELSR